MNCQFMRILNWTLFVHFKWEERNIFFLLSSASWGWPTRAHDFNSVTYLQKTEVLRGYVTQPPSISKCGKTGFKPEASAYSVLFILDSVYFPLKQEMRLAGYGISYY
jgi:hypothetical protein